MNAMATTKPRELFIELEHVSVARGVKTVLHDISLRIAADEHLAILGPNGCGKSTLIKTLTCECYPIIVPDLRVRIFGRERWELFELRKRLGIVEADLPRQRTLHTIGRDAVISGFFSSSTIWPGTEVSDEQRRRADLYRLDLGGELAATLASAAKSLAPRDLQHSLRALDRASHIVFICPREGA